MSESLKTRISELMDRVSPGSASAGTEALFTYSAGILDLNTKVNLTANRDEDSFFVRNRADSLSALSVPELLSAAKVVDVGTGGGFPGVPLAVCLPGAKFTLMDSVGKKLKAVGTCAAQAGITNVSLVHIRAEDAGQDPEFRERFDVCVARAVSELSVLCEYCMPLVHLGGTVIAFKSAGSAEEIESARNAIRRLGGGTVSALGREDVEIYRRYDDLSGHALIIIHKSGATPREYPRKAGTPKSRPL